MGDRLTILLLTVTNVITLCAFAIYARRVAAEWKRDAEALDRMIDIAKSIRDGIREVKEKAPNRS